MSELLVRALARAVRWSGRRAGVAVVYHGIADAPPEPERELVRSHPTHVFAAQVRHLAASYRVVPASQLRAAIVARRRGERFPVAITFDDDLASHHRVALPLLSGLGLSATFFVSGSSRSGPRPFWWERLQAAADAEVLVAADLPAGAGAGGSIHDVASAIDTLAPAERDAVGARLGARLGSVAAEPGLRERDLRALVQSGSEIGAHTLRHHKLPQLDDEALAGAITEGREELATIAGRPLRTIAYPHGGADARVAAAARAAGYTDGFTTHPVAIRLGDDPLIMGRIEPSFHTATRFSLRLVLALTARG